MMVFAPEVTIAMLLGIILDFALGDPFGSFHPVVWMGRLISFLEKLLRKIFPQNKRGERVAGFFLVFLTLSICGGITAGLLMTAYNYSKKLYLILTAVICFFMMATKSLKCASLLVYQALKEKDIKKARNAVAMIVGRDTKELDFNKIASAAVETVAENTSDGSVAPLFYMMIGGPVLCVLYKAVNTMDSMVAYKNDRYRYFGTAAAITDDIFNFIPSRIAAIFMIIAAGILGYDYKNALGIFLRDRMKSTSPNSAQTESVCAGALGLSLLGDTVYFGKVYHKPVIGDGKKETEPRDIIKANRLLYVTVILAVVCMGGIRLGIGYGMLLSLGSLKWQR